MEPVASTSRIYNPINENYNHLDIELHLLIAKYLSLGPCRKSYEVLRKEIEENKILPARLDWLGKKHEKTFHEYEHENSHIGKDYLFKIVSRLVPTIQQLYPTVPLSKDTLFGSGSQSLLRTDKESYKEYRRLSQIIVRFRGNILVEPRTLKLAPNSLHSIVGRELTGSVNRKHFLTNKFYCRVQLFVRNVGHLSAIYCMLFDRKGRYIITGADDMLVKIWSVIDGRLIATLRGASAEISDLAIDQENTLVAAGSCDKIIRVWSLQTLAPVAVLSSHTGIITALQFCPAPDENEGVLISTGGDGCVAFWTYTRKKEEIKFDPKPLKLNERVRPGHAQLICASFSSGGNFLALGGADHFVRLYRLGGEDGVEKLLEVERHTDRIDSIQWCHSGVGFVSGSRDGSALIWRYERQQWLTLPLKMTELLPGFSVTEEDSKRLQVTMVGWDRTDSYVITASSDHLIRIWDRRTGSLKHILKGHEDNAYVIEAHPTDSRLILTAGHDGQLFIWDIIAGVCVKSFKNSIEGQGYGALFDAKWAPDGLGIAATDSHGHILIFGIGDDVSFKKIPQELFFHTDYRPLVRDVNHHVLDEQTQLAPHVMPPPFLVNIDGDPYPPYFQRLVPGRENCRDDQLVPNVILNDDGEQEVMDLSAHEPLAPPPVELSIEQPSSSGVGNSGNRPSIDDMIQRLEQERRNTSREADHNVSSESGGNERRLSSSSHHPDHSYAVATSAHGPLSPRAGRVGSRREGDIEGVRQSTGNWQRHPIKWKRRSFLIPLSTSSLEQSVAMRMAFAAEEMRIYEEEEKKHPEIITGLATKVLSESEKEGGRRYRRRQKNHIYSTRANGTSAEPSASRRGRRRGTGVRRNLESSRKTSNNSNQGMRERQESQNVTNERESSSSTSSSSDEEEEEKDEAVVEEAEEEEESSSSSDKNSTDYSDWTADVGVHGLEPPKRTAHKQKRHMVRKRCKKKKEPIQSESEEEQERERKKERKRRKPGERDEQQQQQQPITSSRVRRGRIQVNMAETEGDIDEIPPEFRPPEWLSETVPKKAPYFPQMGDELMYFRQGHELYVEAVINRQLYQLDRRTLPWIRKPNLRDQEYVKIIGMKYEIKPPRICCVKLGILDGGGKLTNDSFTLKYHDTPDVLDFLVLKKTYDAAVARSWKRGDRFRCIIDDAWWLGMVEAQEPHSLDYLDSVFMCYKVLWDNGERERLSPWDMEPIDNDMELPQVGSGLQVTPKEYKELVYTPSFKEWNSNFEDECARIADGIGKIMQLAAAEPFLTPVDLNVYPNYAMIIEYPIDLSTIKSRLESHFYRRPNAVQFDVRYVATNAEKFNKKGTTIVKHARIVTDLALRLIKDRTCHDPTVYYHEVQASYQSPTQSEDESKKRNIANSDSDIETPRGRPTSRATVAKRTAFHRETITPKNKIDTRPWQVKCKELLKSMFERQDSIPFRFPVDQEQYHDYSQVIDVPMDLTTIREELATEAYQSPLEFAKDVRLVFLNSKVYNTNNRSRIYSMTVRLEAFFEDQFKPILASWKSKGKTGRGRGRPPMWRVQNGGSQIPITPKYFNEKTTAPIVLRKEMDNMAAAGPSRIKVNHAECNGDINGLSDDDEDDYESDGARGSKNEGGMRRSQRVARLRKFHDFTDGSDEDYDPIQKSVRNTPTKSHLSSSKGLTRGTRPPSPRSKGKGGPAKRSLGKRYEDDSDFDSPPPPIRRGSSSSTKLKKNTRYEHDSDFEANIPSPQPPLPHTDDDNSDVEVENCNKKRAKIGSLKRQVQSDSSGEEENKNPKEEVAKKRRIESSSSEEGVDEKDVQPSPINGVEKSEISSSSSSEEEQNDDDNSGSDELSVKSKKIKSNKKVIPSKKESPVPIRTRKRKEEESEVEFDEEELEEEETDEEELVHEVEKKRRGGWRGGGLGAGVRRARRKVTEEGDDEDDEDYVNDDEFIDDNDASSSSEEETSDNDDSDDDGPRRKRKKRRKMSEKERQKMIKEREKKKRQTAREKARALKEKEREKMKRKKEKERMRAKEREKKKKEKERLKKLEGQQRLQSPTLVAVNSNQIQIGQAFIQTHSSQPLMTIYPPNVGATTSTLVPLQISPQALTVQDVKVKGRVIGRKITPLRSIAPKPNSNGPLIQATPLQGTVLQQQQNFDPCPIIEDAHNVAFLSPSPNEMEEYEGSSDGRPFQEDNENDESRESYSGRSSRPKKRIRYTENDSDEDGFPLMSSRGRLRKANSRMRDYI